MLFFIHCCFCDASCCYFYVSGLLFHATNTPPWLLRPEKASTSSELYTLATFDCFTFPSHFYRKSYGFEWVFLTHRRFLRYAHSPHLCSFTTTCFYQGLPWSRQFFLAVCRTSGLILETQTWPICLFDSQQSTILILRRIRI